MLRTSGGPDQDRLAITFERLFGLLRRLNEPRDISLTAGSTLYTLESTGPRRVSDLAIAEGVTQPAMTQLVSRLERAGLAERCPDPADGRVVVVRIAAAGRDLLSRRREARAARLAELLTTLTDEERATVLAALPALDKLAALHPS